MKSIKKGKYNFSFNVELFELLRSREGWEKIVENPRAFVKSDREFEPMDNIKKEKKYEKK